MRAKWKLPFFSFLNNQLVKNYKSKKNKLLIFKHNFRNSTITPSFINSNIKVYNGVKYLLINIREHHVGYKMGNFTITKKRCIFKKNKKK